MALVKVLVLRAPGTNCDEETAFAWNAVGARADRVHVRQLINAPALLREFQILTIPGGFSYGDDIASGKILANQMHHHLAEVLGAFVDRGGLMLGICNGFQVLVRLGLLPGPTAPPMSIALNESGRYEDRWVYLETCTAQSPFLKVGETIHVPVAHAEGRITTSANPDEIRSPDFQNRIALRYASMDGSLPAYPKNPNGSIENAAGLIDRTGRILGLMPHPERNFLTGHAPSHIRDINAEGQGRRLFERAIRALT